MRDKLQLISDLSASPLDAQRLHEKWDTELGNFMKHSEGGCTKFKSCAIEYSPTVGQWIRRRSVLKWILLWHDGKVPDPRNICRAARRLNIVDPLSLSKREIHDRLHSCIEHLFELKAQAPSLRRKHLNWQMKIAQQRGDEDTATEILCIIKNEASRRRQRNINRVVKDSRGRSVLQVQISSDGQDHTYSKQAEVETICGDHLGNRFSLGKRAPLAAPELQQEIGCLSDTDAARRILENDFDFSTTWDPVTVDLLKAAARLRLECEDTSSSKGEVTTEDFTTFWATC